MSNPSVMFEVIAKTDQVQASLAQMNSTITSSLGSLKTQVEEASTGSKGATSKLAKGIGDASKEVAKSFDEAGMKATGAAAVIGNSLSAIPNAYAQATGSLIQITDGVTKSLIELDQAAAKSRLGVVDFVELKDALQAAQYPTEHLPEELATLSDAIGQAAQGSGAARAAFQQLGISTEDWKSKIPPTKDVLMQLADRMRAGHLTMKDYAAAQALLGATYRDLIPFLQQGSNAIREQMEAHRANGEAVKSAIQSAKKFQQEENALSEKLQNVLLPVFRGVVRAVEDLTVAFMAVARAGQNVWDSEVGGARIVIHYIENVGRVINDVFHFRWRQATEDAIAANKQLTADLQEMLSKLKNAWAGFGGEVKEILAEVKTADPAPNVLPKPTNEGARRSAPNVEVVAQKSVIDNKAADEQIVSDANAILGQLPGVQQGVDLQMLALLTQYASSAKVVWVQAATDVEQSEKGSLGRRSQQWGQFFQTINSAFSTFTKSLLSGHETFGQAWTKMVVSMETAYISSLEKQLMAFLQKKLKEVLIHGQAEATKDAASQVTHAKEDTRTAYGAAKAAFESVIHTPIIGPILAPIAAAAAFAAVGALGSAEGGQWEVPGIQMTMLHPREMVLPASLAQGVREAVGAGGGTAGGGHTFNFHVNGAGDPHAVADRVMARVRRHFRTGGVMK